MWVVKVFVIGVFDFLLLDVEFIMQLIYRMFMLGFKFCEFDVQFILNYDDDLFDELVWDEDCVWVEWYLVEDFVKGIIIRQFFLL